jgi:hypothetical protein
MKPDAEKFLKFFLESDAYKAMAEGFTRFWQDGSRRVTTRNGAIQNPPPGQQRTVGAWEGAECAGVYNDFKECLVPCTRGPLDFINRLLPVAENENEADDEHDGENEDGVDKATEKQKINPLYAEADHCHVQVWRYARHLVKVLNRGWLPAFLYKGKVFKAIAHYVCSFFAPEDVNARCVRGLADAFKTSGLVQFKHHICHKEDNDHGDTPYPPQVNLIGFTLAQATLWLETQPPWLVPEGTSEFTPIPNEFTPIPNEFTPIPSKFTPIPSKFSPIPSKFSPIPSKFSPIPSKFTPVPSKFSPIPSKFTPVPSKFSPIPSKFTPIPSKFTPISSKFTPISRRMYRSRRRTHPPTHPPTAEPF